jgi:hypothetical protein
MTLLTATNLASVKSFGEFRLWFASIKVGAIVAFEDERRCDEDEGGRARDPVGHRPRARPLRPRRAARRLVVPWNTVQPETSPFASALDRWGSRGPAT